MSQVLVMIHGLVPNDQAIVQDLSDGADAARSESLVGRTQIGVSGMKGVLI